MPALLRTFGIAGGADGGIGGRNGGGVTSPAATGWSHCADGNSTWGGGSRQWRPSDARANCRGRTRGILRRGPLGLRAEAGFLGYHFATLSGGRSMWLEDHFGNGSMLQRNERVKLAASFWNNIGAGMVIGGMAAAFLLDKPQDTWTKIGIAIVGLVLGWLCYSIASNILTYMHTAPEGRH